MTDETRHEGSSATGDSYARRPRFTWLREGSLIFAIVLVLGMTVLDWCTSVNSALLGLAVGTACLFLGVLRSGRTWRRVEWVPLLAGIVMVWAAVLTVNGNVSGNFVSGGSPVSREK